MPYGRYNRPMRTGYRKYTPSTRRRTAVPAKKKTTRSYVRSNAITNKRQDRQIRTLYKLRYGPLQRNLHLNNTTLVVNATQPICFDASDFGCQRTSTGGFTTPGCTIWQVSNLLTGIVAGSLFVPVAPSNALWAPSNTDTLDGGRYKPVYAEYQIQVQGRNNIDDCHVQMDLFTQHHGFQKWELATPGMSNQQRIMPEALVNMGNMVDVNELNPSLFKLYKRKRLYLNSQTSTTTQGGTETGQTSTTGNTKYFRFRIYPKKPRRQVFTDPDTPGTVEDPQAQTGQGSYSYLQVDPRTPFWCMISANDRTALDGDAVQVTIRRHVVWRDINGGTLL